MKKKCIVTGATGVIGSFLVKYFQDKNWNVILLSSTNQDKYEFNLKKINLMNKKIFKDCSVLIHCAYDFYQTEWHKIEKVNIEGSLELFKIANENGVKKIINISTLSAFEGAKSKYGIAKYLIEKKSKKYNTINLRCGLFASNKNKLYNKLKLLSENNYIFPLIGKGNQKIHLLSPVKLATFIEKIINLKSTSQTYYVADMKYILFRDLIKKFNKKKFFIYCPVFLIEFLLKFFDKYKIKVGFTYDNYLGLVNYNNNIIKKI